MYPPPADIFAPCYPRRGPRHRATPWARTVADSESFCGSPLSTTDPAPADHESTWLMGHTERITFLSDLWEDDGDLYVAAELQVPCRFLAEAGDGRRRTARRTDSPARPRQNDPKAPRRLDKDRFRIVDGGHLVSRNCRRRLQRHENPALVQNVNPCATAACRTADNRRGAACCRDLQIEIMCTGRERRLEALIRARRSPLLCKISRESPFSLSAEMISACGFLLEDGISCGLHGRTRSDGRPAKPDLCSQWPEGGEIMHPGCVFAVK